MADGPCLVTSRCLHGATSLARAARVGGREGERDPAKERGPPRAGRASLMATVGTYLCFLELLALAMTAEGSVVMHTA